MRAPIHTLALISILALLAACSSEPATPESPPQGGTQAQTPITQLKVGMRRPPDSLNPYIAQSRGADIVNQLLYPRLWHEMPDVRDGSPVLIPYLVAEETQRPEPANTLRLKLAQGLTWTDGTPLTTADVVFSLEARRNETVAWASFADKNRIQSWQVVDDHTIDIQFSQESLYNRVILNEGAIIPKHHFSKIPFDQWDRHEWEKDAVVFGPYQPVAFGDERLQFKAVDPETPIQQLNIALVRSKETLFNLLKSGDLDYAWSLPKERISEISEQLQPTFYTNLETAWLAWNPLDPAAYAANPPNNKAELEQLKKAKPHPVLGDARVRQALSLVLNRQNYIDRLWQGHAVVPASPWRVGLGYLTDVPPPKTTPDLDKAATLLQAAGWTKQGASWKKDGRELTFSITCNLGNNLRGNYLQAIQADLALFGVKVELNMVEGGYYIETGTSRAFDAIFFGVRQSSRPTLDALLHSDAAINGNNWTATSALDDLIAKVTLAKDPAELQQVVAEMEQRFLEESPFTMLYSGQQIAAVRAGLSLQADPSHLSPLYRLETWQIGNEAR
ncbi:ABC transporter substrate-binding protein [Acanthopleuribacter pedis]|uniref:Solute-binding protein family 5 domain-containing protein n=1 Tax=Acanthopleuribacter pedis TaxID=442870 RepID=A0A8J7QCE7_9BACT|nr:ABC transporter substrate-binding protein [Acanthopleuribacter pedis]MBO1321549.1 hypothetical protein [Acanthopleuribacter pedis]